MEVFIMKICQYEFQFENEFMEIIEEKLSKLLNISIENFIRKDISNGEIFILEKTTENNYMLFATHKASCTCVVIIRCDVIHENDIRKLLFDICDEIEEEYDEDHRKEVVNVFGNSDTYLKDLEKRHKVSSLFGICVD